MAIYRPPRSPWRARLMMVGVGLVVGGVLVALLLPKGGPSSEERAAAARGELIAAKGALEIVAIEYAESVEGTEVVARPEYEGAVSALARSRARYESARTEIADAGLIDEIDAAFDDVERAVAAVVPSGELSDLLEDLAQALERAAV